jgi:type IV fimbrial biogenesis protein FimT
LSPEHKKARRQIKQGGNHMKTRRGGCRGFTLIELLLVLAVASVLLSVAAPAMSAMIDSVRLRSVSQAMFAALQLARSEAIKRGGRVVLCKSASGADCSHTGGWEQGWIVFHDANNNARVDAGEALLQREPAVSGALRLSGNSSVASYVSYTSLGHPSTTGGGLQMGTLTVCQPAATKTQARQIVISASGRARTQKVTLDQCP